MLFLQPIWLFLTIHVQPHESLQNYFCNYTSTCEDLTLNFSDPNDAYILTCEGYQVCKDTIIVVSSSNGLSYDFTLNCLSQFPCRDTVIQSERQTNIYCGSVGSNDGSRCQDMKIHLTAPENSTNIIYSLGDDDSLSRSDFFCGGDETASCGMIFNGASQFNELYCLGSVASNAHNYTFCLTNCSYESIADNSTNIDRCDSFTAGSGWLAFTNYMYCDSTTQNCIADGGERATNYFDTSVTRYPSNAPSLAPTSAPTDPTSSPSAIPSIAPTLSPTFTPARPPTQTPSTPPTFSPTTTPTHTPTVTPSSGPSATPSRSPIATPPPSNTPTQVPSRTPTTVSPTQPSRAPTTTNERKISILQSERATFVTVIVVLSVVVCLLIVLVCVLIGYIIRCTHRAKESPESRAGEILGRHKNERVVSNATGSNYNSNEQAEDAHVAIGSTSVPQGESIAMSRLTNT